MALAMEEDVIPSLGLGEGNLVRREAYDIAICLVNLLNIMNKSAFPERTYER